MGGLPFHLCQPGGRASCGACCGLYNFQDFSRDALTASLNRHTEAVAGQEKSLERYHQLAREQRALDAPPLFTKVRVCPMLGFLDEGRSKVGCLAHPKVTGGPDLRDCGVYSSQVCESFECPSFLWLDEAQAVWIREACPDWYLYGLVVTDVEFVRGCLRLVSDLLAGPVPMRRLVEEPAALAASTALFQLKEHAPGRDLGGAVFGRFDPDGTGEASLRTIDYRALGIRPAPEDDVVLCLGYSGKSVDELTAAREVVREKVSALALALE